MASRKVYFRAARQEGSMMNETTRSKRLIEIACILLIVLISIQIAQHGYQFGRFLAGH
jgi:hypothetical protein